MGREPLHVEQPGAGGAEQLDEADEGHLGGVGAAVEHRLAGEEPADGDAVEPADQLAVGVQASTLCAHPSSCSRR